MARDREFRVTLSAADAAKLSELLGDELQAFEAEQEAARRRQRDRKRRLARGLLLVMLIGALLWVSLANDWWQIGFAWIKSLA